MLGRVKRYISRYKLHGMFVAAVIFILLGICKFDYASQDNSISAVTNYSESIEKEETLRDRISENEKIYLKKVVIKGVTLVDRKKVKEILLPFKNHWITSNDIKIMIGSITELYKEKGYSAKLQDISYKTRRNMLSITIKEKID